MPKFSVLIAAYNVEKYLPACIASLIAQTYPDFEAVVVDDASTDSTPFILRQACKADRRFRTVTHPVNKGLHLARKTGVEHAGGEYAIFLDGDDELAPDALQLLAERLERRPVDILHFGMEVVSENGLAPQAALGMERSTNSHAERLEGAAILTRIYSEAEGFSLDWRTTQRVYRTDLAKYAFSTMTSERLERAEDSYETFVLAALAQTHESADDVRALRYHFGAGVTGTSPLDAQTYGRHCSQFCDCIEAACAWANKNGGAVVKGCARGLRYQCGVLLSNDWAVRVSPQDRPACALMLARALGDDAAAAQVWRFVRDRAWDAIMTNAPVEADDEMYAWVQIASELEGEPGPDGQVDAHLFRFRRDARRHLDSLETRRGLARYEDEPVRIFVSTHKLVDTFEGNVLQPVQVGAAKAPFRFPFCLQDDAGENISELNPLYCELTTQYWAWKNVDAEYLGFCHYRRYFDFSDERHRENAFGEVMDKRICPQTQRKYHLLDDQIRAAVQGWDVVTTEVKDLRGFPGSFATPREQYAEAPLLKVADLDRVMQILVERHPDYAADVKAFLNGHGSCFCNMFVMRREVFDEYCSWLFPLLEEFCNQTDMTRYSREAARTPGHLSERLLNIWLMHAERCGRNLKRKQVQCVHFEQPDPYYPLEAPEPPDPWRPTVPVVFAADDNYVPMLTTTIHSMLANADDGHFYDVVVLQNGITPQNQRIMREFVERSGKATLRFAEVGSLVQKYHLTTNNAHIGVETYYRFLIQQIMPWYDKVLYLDSDLVVRGDVAKLYDMDLGDNLLAAAHDIDFLGNLNMNDGKRLAYNKATLHMQDPYAYFQAGVLLLNTAEMRKLHSMEEWLKIAGNPAFIYNDQDALNAECEGRVAYLDWRWNVMHDCGGRVAKVFSFAPADALAAYNASRNDPLVVHYAGYEKPWTFPACDFADLYWHYARQTPFYEVLLANMAGMGGAKKIGSVQVHEKAVSEDSPIRRLVDPIAPFGTRRREVLKSIGRALRGKK